MMKLHILRFFENFYVAMGSGVGTATAAITIKDVETWLRLAGLAVGLLVSVLAAVAQAIKLWKQWQGGSK